FPVHAFLRCTLDVVLLAGSAGLTISAGDATPPACTSTADPSTITTDGSSTITVQLKDAAGNNLTAPGGTVVLTTTLGTLDDFQDNADGTYTATLSSTVPGKTGRPASRDGDQLPDSQRAIAA